MARAIRAVVLSIPALLLLLSTVFAADVPQAVLRAVVGVLAVVGCYEVLAYSAGHTSSVASPIPLRINLAIPRPIKILELSSLFILTVSVFKLFEQLLRGSHPAAVSLSIAASYFIRKLLKPVFSEGRLVRKLVVVSFSVSVFWVFSSDSDIKYVESLTRFLEEVVRDAL